MKPGSTRAAGGPRGAALPEAFWKRLLPVLALFCAAGCGGDGPTSNNPPDNVLRFDRYTVSEGDTLEYPAGTTIIAASGVVIDGAVLVDGATPGDFRIVCETGTLAVSGRIIVKSTAIQEKPISPVRRWKRSALRKRAAGPDSPEPARGTSIVLEAHDQSQAHIQFSADAFLRSGDGRDALPEEIASGGGRIEAGGGSDAGDIIVTSFGGTIELPSGRQPESPPIFHLGTGGRGADITVDREGYRTTETSIQIVAGRGGDSGRLVLEADEVLNRPRADDLAGDLVTGGEGGAGGFAIWDNTLFGLWLGRGANITTTFPLEQIVVEGGRGGDGAIQGGRGGHAVYSGLRRINERGDPIATASVYGGDGGDVFRSPVPVSLVIGGDGGAYMVHGNNGWDGAPPDSMGPRDGAGGGPASGRGGDGGNVLEGVACHEAVGGDGGNTVLDRTRIIEDLPLFFTPTDDLFDAVFSVQGGYGGRGTSRCDNCPGGDGGASGMASAIGGDGGSVLSAVPRAVGGRGGDVWSTGGERSGTGGDGNPPGEGGPGATPTVVPGQGGDAPTPGQPGEIFRPPVIAPDGRDGELCGEDPSLCDDSGGTDTTRCEDGSAFVARAVSVQTTTQFTRTIDLIAHGVVVNHVAWRFTGGTHREGFDDHVANRDTVIVRPLTEFEAISVVAMSNGPNCQMGFIQWGDDGGIVVESPGIRTTYDISGCPPENYPKETRDQYTCCPQGSGWRVCRR